MAGSFQVVLVYTPKIRAEEPDWPHQLGRLVDRAKGGGLRMKVFDLRNLTGRLTRLSPSESAYLNDSICEIRSSQCVEVWFAGTGITEATRLMVAAAYHNKRKVEYVGLRRSLLSKVINRWYAPALVAPVRIPIRVS